MRHADAWAEKLGGETSHRVPVRDNEEVARSVSDMGGRVVVPPVPEALLQFPLQMAGSTQGPQHTHDVDAHSKRSMVRTEAWMGLATLTVGRCSRTCASVISLSVLATMATILGRTSEKPCGSRGKATSLNLLLFTCIKIGTTEQPKTAATT